MLRLKKKTIKTTTKAKFNIKSAYHHFAVGNFKATLVLSEQRSFIKK